MEELSYPTRIVFAILIIFFAYLLIKTIKQFIYSYIKKYYHDDTNSLSKYFYNTVKYAIVIFAGLAILQLNGVNVSSAITGLGVATIIVGFALQEYLKDVIMGLYILSDKVFKIGDAVKYGDDEGIITGFTLRTTTIETISCRHSIKICNRDIDRIVILSDQVNINVPLPYEVPTSKAREILNEMCDEIKKIDGMHNAEFRGTQDFGDSGIIYRIKIFCDSNNKNQLRRNALNVIQDKLDDYGIKCPYQQIDVHQK